MNMKEEMWFWGGLARMNKIKWGRCPICGNKTRLQILK